MLHADLNISRLPACDGVTNITKLTFKAYKFNHFKGNLTMYFNNI